MTSTIKVIKIDNPSARIQVACAEAGAFPVSGFKWSYLQDRAKKVAEVWLCKGLGDECVMLDCSDKPVQTLGSEDLSYGGLTGNVVRFLGMNAWEAKFKFGDHSTVR